MTAIPKGVKMPTDHLKPAAQIEAEGGGTVTVQWRGHTFSIPADPDDWPVETSLAFEEGKAVSGVRGVLGPEQWAELMKTKPLNRDLGDLSEALAKAGGFEKSGD